jgi:tRNA U34 5-methylaminomethyl-2-thiouridine-forming methyltransferase MnmC
MNTELLCITTADGSHTLFHPGSGEHYHSTYGAVNESMHVFVGAGFDFLAPSTGHLDILEVGFGTGLNALLTFLQSLTSGHKTHYTGIEPNPLTAMQLESLNYPGVIANPEAAHAWNLIHVLAPWMTPEPLTDDFTLLKWQGTLETFPTSGERFNLVYFDPFSPAAHPELWTTEMFQKLFGIMTSGGVLVTYSCKGTVRRAMQEAGFVVEKIPGPAGKREMVRAIKR